MHRGSFDHASPCNLRAWRKSAAHQFAAAVADAGGLGMVVPTEDTAGMLDQLAGQTSGVFGVNFLMPFLDLKAVEAAASLRAGG